MHLDLLPKELQYSIVRLLDIDSRRHLGIFTRLKVPEYLKAELDNVCKKTKVCIPHCIMLSIGSNRGDSTTYTFGCNFQLPIAGHPPSNNTFIRHRAIGEDDGTYLEKCYRCEYDITSNSSVWKHVLTILYRVDQAPRVLNDIIM
jgi:hypothetical protein